MMLHYLQKKIQDCVTCQKDAALIIHFETMQPNQIYKEINNLQVEQMCFLNGLQMLRHKSVDVNIYQILHHLNMLRKPQNKITIVKLENKNIQSILVGYKLVWGSTLQELNDTDLQTYDLHKKSMLYILQSPLSFDTASEAKSIWQRRACIQTCYR